MIDTNGSLLSDGRNLEGYKFFEGWWLRAPLSFTNHVSVVY